VGTRLVKWLPAKSKLQECVLAAFQRAGWPPWIADPLPEESTPQRTHAHLRDVARRLNNHQKDARIYFFCDGNGNICWTQEPRPKQKRHKKGSRRDR